MIYLRVFFTLTFSVTVTILASIAMTLGALLCFPLRKPIGKWVMMLYGKAILFAFRIKVHHNVLDHQIPKDHKGIILLSNHCSFLDIPLLSSLYRTTFISKFSVVYWPFFGWAAWAMGVIFLKRGNVSARINLIKTLAKDMEPGTIATVFPQGTTSAYSDKRPFHRGIFKVMELNQDMTFLPISLMYYPDREVAWGDESFASNVFKLCSYNNLSVEVKVHPLIRKENVANLDSKELSQKVQNLILANSAL